MGGLHGLEPEQLAQIGIFYLKEAVLDALHEARYGKEWLLPSEISKQIGISSSATKELRGIRYPLIRGILDKLKEEGRVEPSSEDRQSWRLTDEEFEDRCDDL